jgi:hypothetical protein
MVIMIQAQPRLYNLKQGMEKKAQEKTGGKR